LQQQERLLMGHFNLRDWSDYVRGMRSAAESAEMRRHLETGCVRCRADRDVMDRVLSFAARESSMEVSEADVHRVKQLAILHQPKGVSIGAKGICKMLFDSFRQPFAIGVRNAAQSSRQSLYCGGGYCIDIQQSVTAGARSVLLIGQVTFSDGTRAQAPGAMVMLKSGRKILARTVTNDFGEFQLERAPGANFRMIVSFPARSSGKGKHS
jgi:hypothetical protein